jgi:hypothetical protein
MEQMNDGLFENMKHKFKFNIEYNCVEINKKMKLLI